jgi:hypothetical protein
MIRQSSPEISRDISSDRLVGSFVVDAGRALLSNLEKSTPGPQSHLFSSLPWPSVKEHFSFVTGCFIARVALLELALAGSRSLAHDHASYNRMINSLYSAEWYEYLHEKYPEIPRMHMAQIKRLSYLNTVAESFDENRRLLCKKFNLSRQSSIVDIKPVGDYHGGGRVAVDVAFTCGKHLFFKPGVPTGVNSIGALTNALNDSLKYPLRVPATVSVPNGYWQEHIVSGEPRCEYEHLYKLGSWLAVAYATGLSDLHFENILRTMEGPVIVDYECVPAPCLEEGFINKSIMKQLGSLGQVGILPSRFSPTPSGPKVDWGALAGNVDDNPPAWAIHILEDDGLPTVHLSTPRYAAMRDGYRAKRKFFNNTQENAFTSGFSDVRTVLRKSSVSDILAIFEKYAPKPRVVLQSTQIYQNCIRRSTYPQYLQNHDLRRSTIMKWLRGTDNSRLPSVVEHETCAILDAEIPIFSLEFDSDQYFGQKIQSPREFLKARILESCSESRQLLDYRYIRQSFEMLREKPHVFAPQNSKGGSRVNLLRKCGTLEREIGEISDAIADCAYDRSGDPVWINLQMDKDGEWAQANSLFSLYHGSAGVLFALECANRSGVKLIKKTKLIKRKLFDSLFNLLQEMTHEYPVGFFEGMAGIAYSLITSASEEALRHKIAERFCENAIEQVSHLGHDIISGAAGTWLFANKLELAGLAVTNARRLQKACAEQIERLEKQDNRGVHRWEEDMNWVGGLAHGPAGIALAVATSSMAESYQGLLDRAWGSQLSLLRSDGISWYNRVMDESPSLCSWCHGTEGLAMAMVTIPQAKQLLEKQVSALADAPLPTDIGLCHGLAGRFMSLKELHLDLAAEKASAVLLNRILEFKNSSLFLDDSLMLGRAGVLVSLASLLMPGRIPNPLFLQLLW